MADSKQPSKAAAARRAPAAARRAPAADGADGRGKERPSKEALRPDLQPLTKSQAVRLAALTDVAADSIAGRSIAEITKEIDFRIDPGLFLFRRVCGRVVRTDPVSGDTWGVPGATVHVWDTDVNLFGYFPGGWPYGWFLPWGWRREEIGTAQTDACGNFCVWIPRFDIDWVLRWRLQRRCYIDVFRRPSIRDILDRLREVVELPPHIGPWPPDPGPLDFLRAGIRSSDILVQAIGADAAKPYITADTGRFGDLALSDELLDRPAFPDAMPIPEPASIRDALKEHVEGMPKADRAEAATFIEADDQLFRSAWAGPYIRCYDTIVPEFDSILDVPDITFTATQDVDGDGVEETIYSEGLFDVRWDAGPIPPVTLHAKPFAFATPDCIDHSGLPCAAPELVLVGNMPLKNPTGAGVFPIVDTASGYAVRPNRPHPSGRSDEVSGNPATAPLTGVLDFWGCAHHTTGGANASHYRIQHRVSTDGGATFGPFLPILDTWMNWRVVGNPSVLQWKAATQLDGGWWEVLNPADQWLPGDHHLLQWHGPPDGLIELQLELGNLVGTTVNLLEQAAPVRIRVDNSGAKVEITSLAWRVTGQVAWTPLFLNCPTIHRSGQDIQIKVGVHAWAAHLRSVSVGAGGCGAGAVDLVKGLEDLETGVPVGTHLGTYWHRGPNDNNVLDEVVYGISHLSSPGAYSVSATSFSRAFNPADGHIFDPAQPDLGYSPAPNYLPTTIGIAIVD